MHPLCQEFIPHSDVLGVSAVVDALNNSPVGNATESSVLGPFFADDAADDQFNPHFFAVPFTALSLSPMSCHVHSPADSLSESRSCRKGKGNICTPKFVCSP